MGVSEFMEVSYSCRVAGDNWSRDIASDSSKSKHLRMISNLPVFLGRFLSMLVIEQRDPFLTWNMSSRSTYLYIQQQYLRNSNFRIQFNMIYVP